MRTKMRIMVSILIGMLLLLSFAASSTFARNSTSSQQLMQLTASNLYNNVQLPAPPWWHGYQCDSNHYNNDTVDNPKGLQAKPLGTTYRGEVACGPMPLSYNPSLDVPVNFYLGAPTENEWECTELVKRYLYQAFGAPDLGNTFGKDVVNNYTNPVNNTLFQPFANNNPPTVTTAPVPGDVLSFAEFKPGDHGHTAIVYASTVDSTGNGTLSILEQNNTHDKKGIGLLYVGNPPKNKDSGNPAWHIDTEKNVLGAVTGWLHPKTLVPSAVPTNATVTHLVAVSADAANDVWAVGSYDDSSTRNPLIEHWNGSQWSVTPQPLSGTANIYLTGVKAFSPDDVWAVGFYQDSNGYDQTIIEKWDGSSWTQVSSTGSGALYAIDGTSDNEMWAVGLKNDSTALTLHRDSGGWSSVSNSGTSSGDYLFGVSELSSSDIWAVGSGPYDHSFTMHYDGSSWTTVSSPNPANYGNGLTGVSMFGSNDVYAVGNSTYSSYSTGYVMHWDGSSWNVVSSVSSYPNNSGLSAISILPTATTSATNIWTVGNYQGAPLIWHSSDGGTTWDSIPTATLPSIGIAGITINGDNGNVWVVSSQVNSSSHQPLTAFFN